MGSGYMDGTMVLGLGLTLQLFQGVKKRFSERDYSFGEMCLHYGSASSRHNESISQCLSSVKSEVKFFVKPGLFIGKLAKARVLY